MTCQGRTAGEDPGGWKQGAQTPLGGRLSRLTVLDSFHSGLSPAHHRKARAATRAKRFAPSSCTNLGKSDRSSEPQFPHLSQAP